MSVTRNAAGAAQLRSRSSHPRQFHSLTTALTPTIYPHNLPPTIYPHTHPKGHPPTHPYALLPHSPRPLEASPIHPGGRQTALKVTPHSPLYATLPRTPMRYPPTHPYALEYFRTYLIHWRLPPAPRVVPKLRSGGNARVESGDLELRVRRGRAVALHMSTRDQTQEQ